MYIVIVRGEDIGGNSTQPEKALTGFIAGRTYMVSVYAYRTELSTEMTDEFRTQSEGRSTVSELEQKLVKMLSSHQLSSGSFICKILVAMILW